MAELSSPLPVTVVIPAFNAERTLGRAIAGVLAQRPRPPAQVLVVDDVSTDGTAELAHSLGAAVLRRSVNGGAAAARNDGLAAAEHHWIAFLDADDEWLPHHLDALWPHRAGHVLVACAALRAGARPGEDRIHGIVARTPQVLASPAPLLFPDNVIPASGALARRDAVLAVGGYDPTRRFGEDFDLWLRLLGTGTGLLIPRVGCLWHQHEGQKSRRPEARVRQDAIADAFSGEPWWTERLVDARYAVQLWDGVRRALAAGDRRRATRLGLEILARPRRAAAVTATWRFRLSRRRAARAVARDGRARVEVLPGAALPPDAADRPPGAVVDARGEPGAARTARWLREGRPGAALAATPLQRATCRALRVPTSASD